MERLSQASFSVRLHLRCSLFNSILSYLDYIFIEKAVGVYGTDISTLCVAGAGCLHPPPTVPYVLLAGFSRNIPTGWNGISKMTQRKGPSNECSACLSRVVAISVSCRSVVSAPLRVHLLARDIFPQTPFGDSAEKVVKASMESKTLPWELWKLPWKLWKLPWKLPRHMKVVK